MIIAWVISLVAAGLLGYHYNKTVELINQAVVKIKEQEKPEGPKSVTIDTDDPIQVAKIEHDRIMRELNE